VRRLVLPAVLVAVAAGAAGAAIGFLLDDDGDGAPRASRPALRVVSRWHRGDHVRRVTVLSGALGSDPRRGFVLYEQSDRAVDQRHPEDESSRFVRARPRIFVADDRSGPLRIVSASDFSWVLDSSTGTRSVLEFSGERGPALYSLGPRLDPRRLPRIARHGLAVPVVYGPRKHKAVLLVGRVAEATWRLYGYLPGFALPRANEPGTALGRPLLGPGRVLFRVDPAARRLVRVGTAARERSPSFDIPPACSTWRTAGGAFRTCPGSIVSLDTGRTLLRYPGANHLAGRWTFLAPSPDGRQLLLEYSVYACGTSRQSYFLRVGSGTLQPAVPDSSAQSEPLGWLRDGTGSALVASQSTAECTGAEASGIYQTWPGIVAPASQLVVSTSGEDATLWG
jgi:hypothetical protein